MVLGYIRISNGQDKIGYVGIFQTFSDAIRLFSNEQYFPLMSRYFSPSIWFISLFINSLFQRFYFF
jgi:NADH-ubiquinone oxidoreductase chain 1